MTPVLGSIQISKIIEPLLLTWTSIYFPVAALL